MLLAETPQPDDMLIFSEPSSISGDLGLYYTVSRNYTEDVDNDGLGERVYYYRGAVTNNYVVFAGYCWRIVRTNEDGSVRLRFGGTPTIEGETYTCPQTGVDVYIYKEVRYNSTYSDNRYVGYMYGNTCGSYETCHANDVDSNMKNMLEGWYEANLLSYTPLISDVIYCSDRTIAQGTVYEGSTNTKLGYGTNVTWYGAIGRISATGSNWFGGLIDGKPTYKCLRNPDKFTVSNTIGNGKNEYPIGLLTLDEAVYAGGEMHHENLSSYNATYYLYTTTWYWLMSPSGFNNINSVSIVDDTGNLGYATLYNIRHARVLPAISLIPNALVASGTGVYNAPYIIQTN